MDHQWKALDRGNGLPQSHHYSIPLGYFGYSDQNYHEKTWLLRRLANGPGQSNARSHAEQLPQQNLLL
jgi:hypothetical protein